MPGLFLLSRRVALLCDRRLYLVEYSVANCAEDIGETDAVKIPCSHRSSKPILEVWNIWASEVQSAMLPPAPFQRERLSQIKSQIRPTLIYNQCL